MGNESSVLDKCEISGKHVEVDNWRLCRGTFLQSLNVTIPVTLFEKKLRENACKLEVELCNNAIRCLKIYRHPSIVKFHASGSKTTSYDVFMLTEQVDPLSGLLLQMSPLEICAGLHSIMSALSFCHEMCNLRHNNLGMTSIFVTPNGTWKVAGMEFSCLFDQYTEEFRQKNRSFRNENLIPPDEKNEGVLTTGCGYAGDVYAMGLLIEKLLEDIVKSASLPGAKELIDLVKKDVLISDPTKRPTILKLLEHSFFQNDFINICTFLKQITLKSDAEKQIFFQELSARLHKLPEELVASRLVECLFSRFVLMDPFADKYFLLNFLKPFKDQKSSPILSPTLYKEFVIPHIIRIFAVHDQVIRIILLKYFEFYASLIEASILKEKILPEVLLSVKDKSNDLVIFSLKALAFLVPLLGSDIVIGGQRLQYFSESIPKAAKIPSTSMPLIDIKTIKEIPPSVIDVQNEINAQTETVDELDNKPAEDISEIERSSPDGSESSRYQNSNQVEDNDWLDWDNQNPIEEMKVEVQCVVNDVEILAENVASTGEPKITKGKSLGEEFDIMALEIKNHDSSELDFFADMQPKISSNVVVVQSLKADESCEVKSKIFAIIQNEEETAEGWDDL